jgi:general stress protein YciG
MPSEPLRSPLIQYQSTQQTYTKRHSGGLLVQVSPAPLPFIALFKKFQNICAPALIRKDVRCINGQLAKRHFKTGSIVMTTSNKNPGNFANDREKASQAGKKGGQASGGNFANDREKASEAGRKGGQNSHGGGRKS